MPHRGLGTPSLSRHAQGRRGLPQQVYYRAANDNIVRPICNRILGCGMPLVIVGRLAAWANPRGCY